MIVQGSQKEYHTFSQVSDNYENENADMQQASDSSKPAESDFATSALNAVRVGQKPFKIKLRSNYVMNLKKRKLRSPISAHGNNLNLETINTTVSKCWILGFPSRNILLSQFQYMSYRLTSHFCLEQTFLRSSSQKLIQMTSCPIAAKRNSTFRLFTTTVKPEVVSDIQNSQSI